MVRNRKRKHAQCTQDLTGEDRTRNNGSLASTLGRIRTSDSSQDLQNLSETDNGTSSHNGNEAREQRKRRKMNDHGKDNSHGQKLHFPSLTFTALHKLHSSIKIADLQSLILYCIADGIGPQWVSVQSRQSIKKAVVLFIPGLEIGMFDGSITLDHISKTQDDGQLGEGSQEANGKTEETSTSHVTSMLANHDNGFHTVTTSPDAFMPVQMNVDTLPDPLKPLADMFTHLWPVKAPGDQGLSRVYSPLHAMLTSPIPKAQENKIKDKETKGAKPAREEKYWENQRTPITAFISPREELSENEYTAHPALFTLPHEKEQELLRRKAAGGEIGWVDTLVDKLEDGDVAGSEIEQGSLTAGRTVLAMDCEMCIVEGGEYALTRISLIDWDETMIMDELVKPDKPIIDYLTP